MARRCTAIAPVTATLPRSHVRAQPAAPARDVKQRVRLCPGMLGKWCGGAVVVVIGVHACVRFGVAGTMCSDAAGGGSCSSSSDCGHQLTGYSHAHATTMCWCGDRLASPMCYACVRCCTAGMVVYVSFPPMPSSASARATMDTPAHTVKRQVCRVVGCCYPCRRQCLFGCAIVHAVMRFPLCTQRVPRVIRRHVQHSSGERHMRRRLRLHVPGQWWHGRTMHEWQVQLLSRLHVPVLLRARCVRMRLCWAARCRYTA